MRQRLAKINSLIADGLSETEDTREALRIATLMVEVHGADAPIQAAHRLYSLADLGEWREFETMKRAMKFVEVVRPEIFAFVKEERGRRPSSSKDSKN